MPFVCVLPAQPANFNISHNGNKFAVVTRIGYDDTANLNYDVMVGLGGAYDGMEYYFCVVKVDGSDYKETRIWNGWGLPSDCTKQHRGYILDTILRASEVLLNCIRPHTVYRSIDATLPDKALVKHRAVNQIFTNCGYRLTKERTDGQYRVLCMER